jgi:hypothetical protein
MQSYNFGVLEKLIFCVFSKISSKLITFAPLYPILDQKLSADKIWTKNISAIIFAQFGYLDQDPWGSIIIMVQY